MKSEDTPLLNVEGLRTYFFTRRGVAKAVDGVSFALHKGETLGLVGESACGKTMTAMSILRIVPEPAGKIVGGRILFEGEDLLQKSLSEMGKIRGSKISMIFQDPLTTLNPAFTIGEQVGEAIRLHQKSKGNMLWQKVVEVLRLVKIPAAESRVRDYPHQMSGGMRQRVTGAIALSCQPSLLIADEPTTSLDVTIQAQYLALLKEIQEKTQTALLFITHDFGVVARMCHTVAVMYAGKIVERGDVRELFNHPLHPYTKALMDCLPKIEARGDRLMNIQGQPPILTNLPPGCTFSPRCPEVEGRCGKEYPPEKIIGREHLVSCWRAP